MICNKFVFPMMYDSWRNELDLMSLEVQNHEVSELYVYFHIRTEFITYYMAE